MRLLLCGVVFAAIFAGPAAAESTRVRTYMKADGTLVTTHRRTTPDSTVNNNWSTKPNVNPYTGKVGTKEPSYTYKPPKAYKAPKSY